MARTHTYTTVDLEVSENAWEEIYLKLMDAGYAHAIDFTAKSIDMTGISLTLKKGKDDGAATGTHDGQDTANDRG